MGIKFITERTFWWPIKVTIPVDNGEWEEQEFRAKFKDYTTEGLEKAINAGVDQNNKALFDKAASNKAVAIYVSGLITEWEGLQDESGATIPCNDKNKKMVFSNGDYLSGLMDAFAEIRTGGPEAKN